MKREKKESGRGDEKFSVNGNAIAGEGREKGRTGQVIRDDFEGRAS